jgi:type II secretory pathway component GspD/PulD (secretin)
VTQRQDQEVIRKVPLLGDIPLLGWLFKTRQERSDPNQELVIFISPTIVKGGSLYPSSKPPDKTKGP